MGLDWLPMTVNGFKGAQLDVGALARQRQLSRDKGRAHLRCTCGTSGADCIRVVGAWVHECWPTKEIRDTISVLENVSSDVVWETSGKEDLHPASSVRGEMNMWIPATSRWKKTFNNQHEPTANSLIHQELPLLWVSVYRSDRRTIMSDMIPFS